MRRRLLGLSAVVVVALVAGFAWLSLEDPIEPCPVTVVLNGDHPGRADEAAALYRQRTTQQIWLTNDPRSGGTGADAGTISNVGRLTSRGVPAGAVRVLEGAASGTRAELMLVRMTAARDRLACVLAITSAPHTARVKVSWWRLGRAGSRLVVRHAREARYAGWWAHTRELCKTLGALAGVDR